MQVDLNDPIDEETMILLGGFLRLHPKLNTEAAFEIIRNYLLEIHYDPGVYTIETFTGMIDLILQASKEAGSEVIH